VGSGPARKYRELIRAALKAIAADPECGTQRFSVRPDVWGYHIKQPGQNARHIVFYRIARSGTVERPRGDAQLDLRAARQTPADSDFNFTSDPCSIALVGAGGLGGPRWNNLEARLLHRRLV
jgi:plasmid stabilization system protein ParE